MSERLVLADLRQDGSGATFGYDVIAFRRIMSSVANASRRGGIVGGPMDRRQVVDEPKRSIRGVLREEQLG